jgi:hypothetical protein
LLITLAVAAGHPNSVAPRCCAALKALGCSASAGKSAATLQSIPELTATPIAKKRLHDIAQLDDLRPHGVMPQLFD